MENFVKFGHAVFDKCERTDRQTYIHMIHTVHTDRHTDIPIAILSTAPEGK